MSKNNNKKSDKDDDFNNLIIQYGADLEEKTLEKLLDSKLSYYPQIWQFLFTSIFTLIIIFIGIDIKITNQYAAYLYIALVILFGVYIFLAALNLARRNPMQQNTQTIKDYENARIKLKHLKEPQQENKS